MYYTPPPVPARPGSQSPPASETEDRMEIDEMGREGEEGEVEDSACIEATSTSGEQNQVDTEVSDEEEPNRLEPFTPPPPPPSSPTLPETRPDTSKPSPVTSSTDKPLSSAGRVQPTERLTGSKPNLELRQYVKTNSTEVASEIADEIGADLYTTGKKRMGRIRERVKEKGKKWRRIENCETELLELGVIPWDVEKWECYQRLELHWPLKEETDPEYFCKVEERVTNSGKSEYDWEKRDEWD